jgi:hypothetical protein
MVMKCNNTRTCSLVVCSDNQSGGYVEQTLPQWLTRVIRHQLVNDLEALEGSPTTVCNIRFDLQFVLYHIAINVSMHSRSSFRNLIHSTARKEVGNSAFPLKAADYLGS